MNKITPLLIIKTIAYGSALNALAFWVYTFLGMLKNPPFHAIILYEPNTFIAVSELFISALGFICLLILIYHKEILK